MKYNDIELAILRELYDKTKQQSLSFNSLSVQKLIRTNGLDLSDIDDMLQSRGLISFRRISGGRIYGKITGSGIKYIEEEPKNDSKSIINNIIIGSPNTTIVNNSTDTTITTN